MARTLLVGLDGATFTNLDPLFDDGTMPFLKRFIERGVRAELMSTACPVTPPAWTSVMTGRSPGHHGIFDFIHVDESFSDGVKFRLTNGLDVRCETIWSVAARQGRRCGVLNFPQTFQLPPFDGYMVPGFVTSRLLRTSTQPREFWNRIKALPEFNAKDVAWDLDEGRIPLGIELDNDSYREWIDYLLRKDAGWFAIFRELVENTNCELMAGVIESPDRLQHQAWELLNPAYKPVNLSDDERQRDTLNAEYYHQLDRSIEKLVASAGDDARVFFISDHGFGPTTEVFYANTWLEREGYLRWVGDVERDEAGMLTAVNMRDHFKTIDWANTSVYARTTSANGIYIRVAHEAGQPGIPPENYEGVRAKLIDSLLSFKDPATDTPVVIKAVTRDEVFAGQAMRSAPDITLTLRDGGFLSILRSDVVVKPRSKVKGTHRPNGIFVAGGNQIQEGVDIGQRSILDVAPTLLYSIGLPIPEDLEGRIISDVFEPALLQSEPIEFGVATQPREGGLTDDTAKHLEGEDEEAILNRLRALGYVE